MEERKAHKWWWEYEWKMRSLCVHLYQNKLRVSNLTKSQKETSVVVYEPLATSLALKFKVCFCISKFKYGITISKYSVLKILLSGNTNWNEEARLHKSKKQFSNNNNNKCLQVQILIPKTLSSRLNLSVQPSRLMTKQTQSIYFVFELLIKKSSSVWW